MIGNKPLGNSSCIQFVKISSCVESGNISDCIPQLNDDVQEWEFFERDGICYQISV